eukprot:PhM_4_TR5201/c0_g1_i1/m.50814
MGCASSAVVADDSHLSFKHNDDNDTDAAWVTHTVMKGFQFSTPSTWENVPVADETLSRTTAVFTNRTRTITVVAHVTVAHGALAQDDRLLLHTQRMCIERHIGVMSYAICEKLHTIDYVLEPEAAMQLHDGTPLVKPNDRVCGVRHVVASCVRPQNSIHDPQHQQKATGACAPQRGYVFDVAFVCAKKDAVATHDLCQKILTATRRTTR